MLLYNVTSNVDEAVADAWLFFMRSVHIPEVMATGCFVRTQICQLQEEEDTDGRTYAVQYYCPDAATLDRYQREYAPALRVDLERRFPQQFVAFRTVLEVLA
ncbi:MAG: DUF4286 family protein [Hymenobacteraceae bacterium]|nr:DUF4286 family protein [Hymenobacteraceae bacterium]